MMILSKIDPISANKISNPPFMCCRFMDSDKSGVHDRKFANSGMQQMPFVLRKQ